MDVRVGHIDAVSYGKEALTFSLYALVDPTDFILVPNKDVVRVWDRAERGFTPAEAGSCYHGSAHAIVRRPSAPWLVVFLNPLSAEEVSTLAAVRHTELFGSR